jgi:hypothetical protein
MRTREGAATQLGFPQPLHSTLGPVGLHEIDRHASQHNADDDRRASETRIKSMTWMLTSKDDDAAEQRNSRQSRNLSVCGSARFCAGMSALSAHPSL